MMLALGLGVRCDCCIIAVAVSIAVVSHLGICGSHIQISHDDEYKV